MRSRASVLRRLRAAVSLRAVLGGVESLNHDLKNDMVEELHSLKDDSSYLQRATSEQYGLLTGQVQLVDDRLSAVQSRLDEVMAEGLFPLRPAHSGRVHLEDVDQRSARFINDCMAADGPLRESGHFVNHPLTTIWHPGAVEFEAVNERIIEIPFVHRVLGSLPRGSRILDVGGGESTIGLELASLGYATTVLEPRGYMLEHPNLTVAAMTAQDFEPEAPFDAMILLSTIEHLGIGAYALDESDDLDLEVMDQLWSAVVPEGLLVLTTPYGRAATDDLQRIYDPERLARLLTGWHVEELAVAVRRDSTTWEIEDREAAHGPFDDAFRVVLVAARKQADPRAPASGLT